ncbi:MAG TPA: rhodanese-like domain-containing protein [Sedimentisphaerales bacterium]|nr:rhodanese-like domain-containing protein [Sedimentisphaerales bacterium]
MNIPKNKTYLLVVMITLLGGLIPLALYRLTYGQVNMVTPPEAKKLLLMENSKTVLVDIRSKQKYDSAHIYGSQHWHAEEIFSLESKDYVPEQFHNKTLLLMCNVDISSNDAAKHLKKIGFEKVMSVRGGLQEWIGSIDRLETKELFTVFQAASGQLNTFPIRVSPLYEQLLAVTSGFGVKLIYTILSLIIVIILWRSKAPDLTALRWAMIFFFLGENSCAINYFAFTDKSYFFEYLHSYGMLLSFGFATYAILQGMDGRILMLSAPDKKCAALGLCKKCIKYENVPCGLKRTFFMIIPASILLALMPLCADWHDTSYNTMILGTFYNYTHRIVYQQFEILYCPIITIIILIVSLLVLYFKKDNPLPMAKIFFAAGIGPLGFGMFRSILAGMYSQNMVWFNFWEEVTELLFIVGVCFILWVFRQSLFKNACIAR